MNIKDIAKLANVSPMTVSNVIHGHSERVSKATSEKVLKIMNDNNYVPNLSARSLHSSSSNIIAIIVPQLGERENINIFSDPYISQMIGIFEKELREEGYFTMIRCARTIADINLIIKNWNIDGVIFIWPFFENLIDQLISNSKIPMVFVDSFSEDPNAYTVNSSNFSGAYLATKHLLDLGHRNIAYARSMNFNHLVDERFNGYCKALEEVQIPINNKLIFKTNSDYQTAFSVGKDLASEILANKNISAVITNSDVIASGISAGVRNNGLTVPKDLSIIGYNDSFVALHSFPNLTSVNQFINEKAEKTVLLLLDKIKKENKMPNKIVLDVELIKRESTSILV